MDEEGARESLSGVKGEMEAPMTRGVAPCDQGNAVASSKHSGPLRPVRAKERFVVSAVALMSASQHLCSCQLAMTQQLQQAAYDVTVGALPACVGNCS